MGKSNFSDSVIVDQDLGSLITGTSTSTDATGATIVDTVGLVNYTTDDAFVGQSIHVYQDTTNPENVGISQIITAYNATTKTITVDNAFPAATTAGVTKYRILARESVSGATVEAECEDALEGENLDHLVKVAYDTDLPTTVHDNSVVGCIVSKANVSGFDRTTHSLEYLGDELIKVPKSDGSTSWNSTALAAIEGECEDAIEADNLDHLLKAAVDTNLQTTVADNSSLGYLFASANVSNYDRTKHSLQAIGADTDSLITAVGSIPTNPMLDTEDGSSFSAIPDMATATAQGTIDGFHDVPSQNAATNSQMRDVIGNKTDTTAGTSIVSLIKIVDTVVDKIPLSDGTNSWNATALAAIESECNDALVAKVLDHLAGVADGGTNNYPDSVVQDSVFAYLMSPNDPAVVTDFDNSTDSLPAIASELAKVPKSDGTSSWNATALAAIEGECTDAIEADHLDHVVAAADGGTHAYPDSVVQDSIFAYLMSPNDPAVVTDYDNSTDSLPALYNAIAGSVNAVNRQVGRCQIFSKNITSAANAGSTTVATITTAACFIEAIVLKSNGATTGDLTSAAVKGGASAVVTFLDTTEAAKANIDADDEQVAWFGAAEFDATETIIIDLQGTGATAVDLDVIVKYRAAAAGGYLV